MKLIDIQAVKKIIDSYGATLIVDNTFATPYFQKPLSLGAGIVVHSLSKYLNGHSDVLGGVSIAGNQEYIDKLKFSYMCQLGSVMDANSAYLILRGLKTSFIRMKQHEQNALAVADYLNQHPKIKTVIYPGLENYAYRNIQRKQMTGYGAIISFYLKSCYHSQLSKFLTNLSCFKLAVSFGGTESLVEYPLYMTHREYLEDKDSRAYHQLKNLIRLSIGLENTNDLIADLGNSLNQIK